MKWLPGIGLVYLASVSSMDAAESPRLEAAKRAREAAVQSAGIDRALSKEMPPELAALPVFGEIEWRVESMPFVAGGPHAGISGAGMAVVDGKILIAGGFIPAGDETQDTARRSSRWLHQYDPATCQWQRLADMPGRREYTRAAAHSSHFYIIGGAAQNRPTMPYADAFRWNSMEESPRWEALPSMKTARTHAAVGAVHDRLIVAGGNNYSVAEKGYSPKTILGSTEWLDLTAREKGWQAAAAIPGVPRGWCGAAVQGGKLYLLGGVTWTAPARTRLTECLAYDAAQDEWQTLAPFPIPISGWAADTFQDRWLILVGGAGTRWNDVPFVYDTQENRWLRIPSPLPPGALFNDCGVAIIGDTLYIAGGEGSGGSHFNHFLIGKIKPSQTFR